jgi:stearoyl-CoA desaturase (delta-9 desaturase)
LDILIAATVTVLGLYITNLGTTIYLHRGLAHKGIRFNPVVALAFRVWLWLSIGVDRLEWVAVHRKHHRYTDVEGDPHSPHLHGGMIRLLFTNYLHYRREARNPETIARYTKDIDRDVFDRIFHSVWALGPILGVAILMFALGPLTGLAVFFAHAGLYILLSGAINSICHESGYRNFDNTATNVRWIALITAGEGLHNNHHEYPACPKLSMARWEVDPAWWFVRLLCGLRLAEIRGTVRKIDARGSFEGEPSALVKAATEAAEAVTRRPQNSTSAP